MSCIYMQALHTQETLTLPNITRLSKHDPLTRVYYAVVRNLFHPLYGSPFEICETGDGLSVHLRALFFCCFRYGFPFMTMRKVPFFYAHFSK